MWLLGDTANYAYAQTVCLNPYRLPSPEEGLVAASHGIRIVAESLNMKKDFWTNETLNSGQAKVVIMTNNSPDIGFPIISSSQYSVFCIKD
jgi:hypothetical protein